MMMRSRAIPVRMPRVTPDVAGSGQNDRKAGVNPKPGVRHGDDRFPVGGPTADLFFLSNPLTRHKIEAVASGSWTEIVDLATDPVCEITDADALIVPVQ